MRKQADYPWERGPSPSSREPSEADITLIPLGRGENALRKLADLASMPPGVLALTPRLQPVCDRGHICMHCLLMMIQAMGEDMERRHGARLALKRVLQFMSQLEQMTTEELREWWEAEHEERLSRPEDGH